MLFRSHFWEHLVEESNRYAHDEMIRKNSNKIAGAPWKCDILLQEFMVFFGILLHITLHPIPGRDYTYLWDHPLRYTFTSHMLLRRFQQIRSVLHCSNNNSITHSNDHLFKVRPMLNILKKRLGNI